MELAELGLSVRSDGVATATNRLDKMSGASKRATTQNEKMVKQFRVLKAAIGPAVLVLGAWAAASLKVAIAAEETASKFQVVFRGSVKKTNEALIELTRTIPMTLNEMRGLSSGVQDMLVPMGLARDKAAELSVTAVKLAGDIGSFNNVDPSVALAAITSGLAGQSESLRKYGIDASVARLEMVALEEGYIQYGETLTSSAKAQALFTAIQRDSSGAMGDAERTMDSTANQLKFMSRDITQAKEDLGQALIPAFHQLLTAINKADEDGITPFQSALDGLGKAVIVGVSALTIVKEAALLLGETLLGLAANVVYALKAIAAPFVEFIKTMADAYNAIATGEFAAAADAFDGLGQRIASGFRENSEKAADALGFIGESLETRVGNALNSVSALMNTFTQDTSGLSESATAIDEVAASFVALAGGTKITAEQAAELSLWWDELRAVIDPIAEATRNYDIQVSNLNLAIAEGIILETERAAVMAQLRQEREDANGDSALAEWWAGISAEINPAAAATANFNAQVVKLFKAVKAGKANILEVPAALKLLRSNMDKTSKSTDTWMDAWDALKDAIDPAAAAMGRFKDAVELMNKARAEMESGGEFLGDTYWDNMEAGLSRAILGTETLGESLERAGNLAGEALRGIQSSMTDGSKAYEAMNIAIQAANVVSAIGAIINQGSTGDPYTAFARMAAMAAAVASLGVSISGFGGDFADTAAQRQETQGTGSVLGDAAAKSESIVNAVEITASATSELVGINRGMLRALTSLQSGLTGASSALARNPQGGEFSALPNTDLSVGFAPIFDNLLGGLFNKVFGGKAKITDEGIAILAGSLSEAINGSLIQAFQEIKYKKWIFGSTKTREELIALGDDATAQIGLIFQAISDTVREGALALGLDAADIQAALDAFKIEEMRISLKGLSAEDAQAELEAVFSKIFDDLAMAVIPFLGQFQKVGEGLGETLVRVATTVQVMQEAIKQLGWAVDETDPERFAQISVGLIEMVGGIEEFITQMQSFVSKFATDAFKLSIATDAITRGFASVGLVLPDTADGLWDLMQSLDATTEEGQRQIAMILELSGYASTYYDMVDEAERERMRLREEALSAEVDALLYIQSIAEGVANSLQSLRDMIVSDLATTPENYERSRVEAEELALALATMTDPDMIAETVSRIEALTRGAYGMLDETQQQAMGPEILAFLEKVQTMALARLALAAEESLVSDVFTPEEILARFNSEVTDPLILVAELQENAALMLVSAAEYLMGQSPGDFNIAPNIPDNANVEISSHNDISAAVEAGMRAGAEAMAEAAVAIVNNSENTNATSTQTAQQISAAIRSIPQRIVVNVNESEFG